MPPLPVIANVVAVAVKGHTANGRQWVNTYHFLKGAGESVATAISKVDPIYLALYKTAHTGGGGAILDHMNAASGLDAIYYLPLDGTSATTIISHAFPGTAVTDALAANVTLTVTRQTGLRGRDKRGRVFLPPQCEGDNSSTGLPIGTIVAAFQAQFNGFLTDMTTAVELPVVASYKHAAQSIITGFVVRGAWASRRRRVGRPV